MIRTDLARDRVRLAFSLPLPFSRERAWEWIRDFSRIVRIDPLHSRVIPPLHEPRAGAEFLLLHGGPLVRVRRRGRILEVVEGWGYSFSDLSLRGSRRGFPHVFRIHLEATTPTTSCLRVEVRGRWTARRVPLPLRRLWLRTICAVHRLLLSWAAEAWR